MQDRPPVGQCWTEEQRAAHPQARLIPPQVWECFFGEGSVFCDAIISLMEGGFVFFEAPPPQGMRNPQTISAINRARLVSLQQDSFRLFNGQIFDQPYSTAPTPIPLERSTNLFTAYRLATLRIRIGAHLNQLNGISRGNQIHARHHTGLDALKECIWLSIAFGRPNLSFTELFRIAKKLAISDEVLFSGLAPTWGNEDFFKKLINWYTQKNSLQAIMRSGGYRVFWQAARYGRVELLKIISKTVPDTLIEMARACDDAASQEAIRWNHLESLKYIVEIIEARTSQESFRNYIEKNFIGTPEIYAGYSSFYSIVKRKNLGTIQYAVTLIRHHTPDRLSKAIARGFTWSAANGSLEIFKYFLALAAGHSPDELLNIINIEIELTIAVAMRNGHLNLTQHLVNLIKEKAPDQLLRVMQEASDFYVKHYYNITGKPPYFTYSSLITLPDCFPALFDHAAQHPDHTIAFKYFIDDYIGVLKNREEIPDIGDRDVHILYAILQYLMKIDTRFDSEKVWLEKHLHFILSLSRLQEKVKQNANQAVDGNALLRLAIRFDNRTAEDILLAIPDVKRVANEHDLYKREEIRGSGIISAWTKIDFTPAIQSTISNNTDTTSADKPSITLLDDQSPAINPSMPAFISQSSPADGKSAEKARLWKELVMIMQIYQDTLRQVRINQHDHASYQNVNMLQQTARALDALDERLMHGKMDTCVATTPYLLTHRIRDFTKIINSINLNTSEHTPLTILKELAKKMVQSDTSLHLDYQNMQWSDAREEFTKIVTDYLQHLERSISRNQDTQSLLSKKQAIMKDLAHHLTIGNSDQEAVLRGLAFFDIMINRNDMSMLLSERRCGQHAASRDFSLFVKRIDNFLKNPLYLSARYRPFTRVEFERVTEKISLFRRAYHLVSEPNTQSAEPGFRA
jgi:hypothetical protein